MCFWVWDIHSIRIHQSRLTFQRYSKICERLSVDSMFLFCWKNVCYELFWRIFIYKRDTTIMRIFVHFREKLIIEAKQCNKLALFRWLQNKSSSHAYDSKPNAIIRQKSLYKMNSVFSFFHNIFKIVYWFDNIPFLLNHVITPHKWIWSSYYDQQQNCAYNCENSYHTTPYAYICGKTKRISSEDVFRSFAFQIHSKIVQSRSLIRKSYRFKRFTSPTNVSSVILNLELHFIVSRRTISDGKECIELNLMTVNVLQC